MPWIDRDRPELHDVEERRQVTANEPPLRLEALIRDRFHPHAIGRIFRRALLVERHSADAIRKPFHHQRPVGDRRQQVRGHAGVVRHQIALGVAAFREEALAEIGDLEILLGRQMQDPGAARCLELADVADQIVNSRPRDLRRARPRPRPPSARSPVAR